MQVLPIPEHMSQIHAAGEEVVFEIDPGTARLRKLVGMYREGQVYLIYGPTGSGKTTLFSYLPIIMSVKNSFDHVKDRYFYIVSTDGGFDINRLIYIAREHGLGDDMINHIKSHINVFYVTEFSGQHEIITDTIRRIATRYKPAIISVDSIANLYALELTRVKKSGDEYVEGIGYKRLRIYPNMLNEQVETLYSMAVNYGAIVFITSWLRTKLGEQQDQEKAYYDFIGGKSLRYYSSVILRTEILKYKPKIVKVECRKHRFMGVEGKYVKIKLSEKGVEDYE